MTDRADPLLVGDETQTIGAGPQGHAATDTEQGAVPEYDDEYAGVGDQGIEAHNADVTAAAHVMAKGTQMSYTDEVPGIAREAVATDAHRNATNGVQLSNAYIDHDAPDEYTPRPPSSGRAPVHAQSSRTEHAKASAPYARTPDMRKSHKMAERRRRKEVRELFDELRDQIPGEQGSKASKWEVLSKAIEHVSTLQLERDSLLDEVQTLRASVGHSYAVEKGAEQHGAADVQEYGEQQVDAEEEEYSYEGGHAYPDQGEGDDVAVEEVQHEESDPRPDAGQGGEEHERDMSSPADAT